MQISLREDSTNETEIKNEPCEDDLSSSDDLRDPDLTSTEQLPGSVFSSASSQPTTSAALSILPVASSSQQCSLSSDSSLHTAHTQNLPQNEPHSLYTAAASFQSFSNVFNSQCGSGAGVSHVTQTVMNTPQVSPQTVTQANTYPRPTSVSGDEMVQNYLISAPKKPKLGNESVAASGLLGNGCGQAPTRVPTLCCCPEVHTTLLKLAQEEHLLRMKLLREEEELRVKEHTARSKILFMKEEIVRERRIAVRNENNKDELASGPTWFCLLYQFDINEIFSGQLCIIWQWGATVNISWYYRKTYGWKIDCH